MKSVSELATFLGPRKSLCAIVTEPERPRPGAPLVLLLTAGIMHRVGANRLHVIAARRLAEQGYCAVRFDLSGIGDSVPRPDALPLMEGAVADIREALDHLEANRGTREVVLVGMCSGAMHALAAAYGDHRVTGVVLLDLFVPPTPGFHVRYWLRRSINFGGIWRLLVGRHPSWGRLRRRLALQRQVTEPAPRVPDAAEVRRGMAGAFEQLVERKVRLLALFTEGHPDICNYPGQLLEAFPAVRFQDALRLEYFRRVDHTFTLRRDQERLLGVMTEWFAAEFPGTGSPGE